MKENKFIIFIVLFAIVVVSFAILFLIFYNGDYKKEGLENLDSELVNLNLKNQLTWNNIQLRDDTIYNANGSCQASYAGISAYFPQCDVKTLTGSNIEQRATFTTNRTTTFLFVYTDPIKSGKIFLWRNYSQTWIEQEEVNDWINNYLVDSVISYIDLGTPDLRCQYGNTNNNYMYEVTRQTSNSTINEVYCFSQRTVINATAFRISGNRTIYQDYNKTGFRYNWDDITDNLEDVTDQVPLQLRRDFRFYKISNVNAGSYDTKWIFTPHNNKKSGKFHVLAYPSNKGLLQAYLDNDYMYQDPSWNSTYNDGLVAYWNFDSNSSGVIPDIHSGRFNLTCGSCPINTSAGGSKINYSFAVDTRPGPYFVGVGDKNLTGLNGNTITINCWAYLQSVDTYRAIVSTASNYSASGSFYYFLWATRNGLSEPWEWEGSTGGHKTSTAYPVASRWSMYTISINGGNWATYHNGTLNNSGTTTSWQVANNGTIAFGDTVNHGSSTPSSNMLIDECGIWNRSLNAGEILDLYNDGNGLTYSSFVVTEFGITTTLNSPANNLITNQTNLSFSAIATPTNMNITNVSFWLANGSSGGNFMFLGSNSTASTQNNTITIYNRFNISEGVYHWNALACATNNSGSVNCSWASSNRTLTIDTTPPRITIYGPTGNQGIITAGLTLTLNYSIIDTNNNTCLFIYNSIYNNLTCSGSTFIFNATSANTLTVWANDSTGQSSTNTTSWYYGAVIDNPVYNNNTFETDEEVFNVSVILNSSAYISANVRLFYNGSFYNTQKVGDNYIATLDIPLIETGLYQNKTFNFEITLYNGTESSVYNSSRYNQTVNRLYLGVCNATQGVQTLNFTAYYEINLTRVQPFVFGGNFYYWMGSGDVKRNTTFTSTSLNERTICINRNDTRIYTDAIIEYGGSDANDTFLPRTYLFNDFLLTNITNNQSLYLLETTDSTTFIIKVQDNNLQPYANVYVHVQRYYPDSDSYQTVSISKTDANGKTLGFYKTETVYYRHLFYNEDGELLLQTDRQLIFPESTYTLTFTIGSPVTVPWLVFEEDDNLSYSLSYNNTLNSTYWIYIDSSGNFTQGRLYVERINNSGQPTVICNSTSGLSTSAITCDLSSFSSGSFIAKGYITRGSTEKAYSIIRFDINDAIEIFGREGLFLAWFLILVGAMVVLYNPIVGLWLTSFITLGVNLLGLVDLGTVWITGLFLITIIISAISARGSQ